jgi:hypothetical protein
MNNEMVWIWKDAFVVYFKAVIRNSLERIGEKYGTPLRSSDRVRTER